MKAKLKRVHLSCDEWISIGNISFSQDGKVSDWLEQNRIQYWNMNHTNTYRQFVAHSRKLPHFEIQHCFQTTLTYLLTHIHWFAQVKTNHTHMISLPYETDTFIYDMFNGKSSTCITSSQSHNIGLLIECLPLLSWRIKWKLKFMLRIFITCTSTCHLYFAKYHVWLTLGLDYSGKWP